LRQSACTTGYARLTPPQARVVLALIALAIALGTAVALAPTPGGSLAPHAAGAGDVALYRAEVDRIHNGEGYYQAAAAELTARGYPTRSVFNWRTPLPMWLLGKLPTAGWGRALLGAMSLALVLMAFEALAREEKYPGGSALAQPPSAVASDLHGRKRLCHPPPLFCPAVCALLLTGPLQLTILGDVFVMPVLWAGVLIGLSVCAYGLGRSGWGVAFGLAALFFRELALPYCLLCVALAWRQAERTERAAWTLGLLAWLLFFVLHCWHVAELIGVGARAHRLSWIHCGGAEFVIATTRMNAYLLVLPPWVTALYLVVAMVGLGGWSTPLGTRIGLSTCLYLAAFAVVGQSFNQYWGLLVAPLLCFGIARFPAALGDLWRAAFRRPVCA
jgi:hypothetical protein